MMYKRYREESEATTMVWFPFVTLLFAILTTKIGCMDDNCKHWSHADRGRERVETDEKDNGSIC